MTIDDPGSLSDPRVGRIDDLGKIVVRHDALGQMRANAANNGAKYCDHA
jgi:hypothetical protein